MSCNPVAEERKVFVCEEGRLPFGRQTCPPLQPSRGFPPPDLFQGGILRGGWTLGRRIRIVCLVKFVEVIAIPLCPRRAAHQLGGAIWTTSTKIEVGNVKLERGGCSRQRDCGRGKSRSRRVWGGEFREDAERLLQLLERKRSG